MAQKAAQRWIVSRGISIRKAAADEGFDIEYLEKFEQKQQDRFRKKIVRSIIDGLDEDWEESAEQLSGTTRQLDDVRQGVYVLCLDGGLCVQYKNNKRSRVLYIGKGALRGRIKSHLQNKLLNFFLELPGIKFTFYLTEAKRRNSARYFEILESDLLEKFGKTYGERPLFNKNAGVKHEGSHSHKQRWDVMLKNVKADYKWAISSAVSRDSTFELRDR